MQKHQERSDAIRLNKDNAYDERMKALPKPETFTHVTHLTHSHTNTLTH